MVAEMPVVHEQRVLRETVGLTYQLLSHCYGTLKAWAPMTMETVEGQVNQIGFISPLYQELEKRANPLLDRLDDKVSPLVIEHVQPLVTKGMDLGLQKKEELLNQKDQLLTKATQKKEELVTRATEATELAKQKKDDLLSTAHVQWGSLKCRGKANWEGASKATAKRIEESLQRASAFTSQQSMNFLQIDLIEYSKTFLDSKKPAVEAAYAKFEATLEGLKPAQLSERVQRDYPAQAEKVEFARKELRLRLDAAMARARWLGTTSMTAPGIAYQMLLQSPELYHEVKSESFKRMLEASGAAAEGEGAPDASELVRQIGPYTMVALVLKTARDVLQQKLDCDVAPGDPQPESEPAPEPAPAPAEE